MLDKQAGYRLVFLLLEKLFPPRLLSRLVHFLLSDYRTVFHKQSSWSNCTTTQNRTPVALKCECLWRRLCSPDTDLTKIPQITSQSNSLTLIDQFHIAVEGECFWVNKEGILPCLHDAILATGISWHIIVVISHSHEYFNLLTSLQLYN